MKSLSGYRKRLRKPAVALVAAILLSNISYGQDREKYDSLAAKYKGQHAVYTNISEQLVISVEDGELTAHSNVALEKLFLTDLSLDKYNMDYFWYGDFNVPTDFSGFSYLPVSNKKYKKVECHGWGTGKPYSYEFYDDQRVAEAYYSGLCRNAITETKYTLEYPDIYMLPSFEFQDIYESLPVAKASYEVVAPSFVKMNFVMKGQNTSWIKQTKEEKNGKVYYRFTASDVPAPKSFDHVPSWRYYVPHVLTYVTSYRLTGAKKDSVLANSPDDLYRHLYNNVRSKNLKLDTFLTKTVDQITKDDMTQREKAAHIYKWVQENIHYVAIENGMEGFVPRPADTVFKRKYGDCKDMSSIISAMCQRVGIKAYFAWIGTSELPYTFDETPIHISNHMICAVKLDDDWVFLDGTHALLPFGCNRDDIQGKEAMIAIDEHNYKIVTIPVEPATKNITLDSTHITIDENKLTGNLQQLYKGYGAWNIGYGLMYNKKEEDKKKMIKALTARGTNKYSLGKYSISTDQSGNKDVTVKAEFSVDGYVQHIGKECIVNMNLLRHAGDEHIDTKDRTVANYFEYKNRQKEVVVMDIPKGYHVSYLPPAAKGSLDDVWNYSITYNADKDKVTLTKEYEVNAISIDVDKFADNNKVVAGLKKIYKESVVLAAN